MIAAMILVTFIVILLSSLSSPCFHTVLQHSTPQDTSISHLPTLSTHVLTMDIFLLCWVLIERTIVDPAYGIDYHDDIWWW